MWLHGMSIFTNDLTKGDDMECMIINVFILATHGYTWRKKIWNSCIQLKKQVNDPNCC
jgi:hypothetical protein